MEDMKYFDVMVDTETTGLDPSHSAVIQIAAVKFNLAERKIETSSMFNRCLYIPANRWWDEGTREWWGKQKRSVLEDIYQRMEDPAAVINAFGDWCGYTPGQPLRFWAKPTSFDWPFLQSYFKQFDVPNPFHYRYSTDLNSFIRGLARDSGVEQFKVEFQGDAHNALMDSINQISSVFSAMDHYASN